MSQLRAGGAQGGAQGARKGAGMAKHIMSLKPSFSTPSRFSTGTFTSRNTTSDVPAHTEYLPPPMPQSALADAG